MGILCVFCVYDTIGNRCFEKTSFPKMLAAYLDFEVDLSKINNWQYFVTERAANAQASLRICTDTLDSSLFPYTKRECR